MSKDDENNIHNKNMENNNKNGNDEINVPSLINRINNYNIHEWIVRGNKDLFDTFNVYRYLKQIKMDSQITVWYPTIKGSYPPLQSFDSFKL